MSDTKKPDRGASQPNTNERLSDLPAPQSPDGGEDVRGGRITSLEPGPMPSPTPIPYPNG